MKLLVTGGHAEQFRSYDHRMWLYAGLSFLHAHPRLGPITEVIEGGAAGFDNHAKNWVLWRKACGDTIVLTTVEAEWERYSVGLAPGRKNPAGAIRNGQMAKMRPDVVLACPGGPGTANMVEIANAARLNVIRLEKMPVVGPTAQAVPPPPTA